MSDQLTKELVDRYVKLDADQANWRVLWQDLADYICPRKSNVINIKTPGSKQTEKLFDSTAINANEHLAASMCSYLTPSNGRWFYLKTRDEKLNENKSVAEWLEEVSSRMELAIHQSNFNAEVHESYIDIGAFGTKAIYIEENPLSVFGFSGLNFKAFSIGEYVTIENIGGRVNGLFRKFDVSALEAQRKWKGKIPDTISKVVDSEPDKKFPFLWICLPKAQWKENKAHPFASVYISLDDKELISEGGFYEFPVPVSRWGKTASEQYGRGPGHTALPDIKTLNKLVELELRAKNKAIDPPLIVRHKGVIGSVAISPAGVTTIERQGDLATLPIGTNFQVIELTVDNLQKAIRRIFFSDQLQLQEAPQMTAAEVYVRYELMQRILGPTLGRLESEFLNPLVERIFGIMYRAGALPPMPDVLMRYLKGRMLDIEYEGPLARAQRLGEVAALQKFFSFVGPMAEAKPEVLDLINFDDTVREIAEVSGVPSKLLRDDEEIARIRENRAAAIEEQKKKQELAAIAEGAGKVAPALKAVKELMPGEGEA